MKSCKCCGYETNDLFAPFDKGQKQYCSDCQMEAENEMQENEQYDYQCGVGPAWEGY
jgi:hypothetical protein